MHVFYGIAKTIMDGCKDADQQYEFAQAAKAQGKPDLAIRHIEEAKKRLAGVKEWYDIGTKQMQSENPEPMVEAVMELLLQHHRSTLDKIATFKPGA